MFGPFVVFVLCVSVGRMQCTESHISFEFENAPFPVKKKVHFILNYRRQQMSRL